MKTSDFDYSLPPELIAQTPIEPRDHSRLMVVNCRDRSLQHRRFFEIVDYLQAGDVLVFNDSRVIPARLSGKKTESGGKLEILLLQRLSPNVWQALVRPARRVKVGTRMEITGDSANGLKITAEVTGAGEGGTRVITFSDERLLPRLGQIALPPYIHTPLADPERYQTVYAQTDGSVAAPTAGLHFTPELIDKIRNKGVRGCFVTLHVGLDTFQPVREDNPLEHRIHQEYGVLSPETANELSRAKAEGRRVICVGTTSVRLVEAVAQANESTSLKSFAGWINLFIVPGYQFRMADVMITNFHLPRTTLMMLVSAFAGRDFILQAYQEAITQKYRFYSFGDAMVIL
jgi:S-adenosylmethionine:tRNA ribosyltransferase-isomerase